MTEAELWAEWRLWMLIAVVIVLAAATLLIIIWLEARRILRHAVRALRAGQEIQANTQCIWELQTTNEVVEELAAARTITTSPRPARIDDDRSRTLG